MNAVPFLLIGIPAAAARYAQWKLEQGRREVEEVEPVEYVEAWPFDEIRARHPWLGETEVR